MSAQISGHVNSATSQVIEKVNAMMIRVMMLVEKPNMKPRVIRTTMRETKNNHSKLLNLRRKIKTEKIETLRNKIKDITEGKTDSQDMPNLP